MPKKDPKPAKKPSKTPHIPSQIPNTRPLKCHTCVSTSAVKICTECHTTALCADCVAPHAKVCAIRKAGLSAFAFTRPQAVIYHHCVSAMQVVVGPVPGKGMGLRAKASLPMGAIVGAFIFLKDAPDPVDQTYAERLRSHTLTFGEDSVGTLSGLFVDYANASYANDPMTPSTLALGRTATTFEDIERFQEAYQLDARDRANATIAFSNGLADPNNICLQTTRDIDIGEEVMWPYGFDYWIHTLSSTPDVNPTTRLLYTIHMLRQARTPLYIIGHTEIEHLPCNGVQTLNVVHRRALAREPRRAEVSGASALRMQVAALHGFGRALRLVMTPEFRFTAEETERLPALPERMRGFEALVREVIFTHTGSRGSLTDPSLVTMSEAMVATCAAR